ncbi:MAG: N-acetylmuramoyl-L-alanine amidase [Deltaproteobacteria bacterium]|nr:N-acetylmuramoyl-L-alanine amidase [Deltaproteobacteria bacterium]
MIIAILMWMPSALLLAAPQTMTAAIFNQQQDGFTLQLFLSDEVQYSSQSLPFDHKNQIAARFFVDLFPVTTTPQFALPEIDDNLWVQKIRVGKNTPDKIRLVLDLTSLGEKQAFTVTKNSKGLLIAAVGNPSEVPDVPVITKVESTKSVPILKKNKDKTYRIVIDPGHGGADPGASGVKGTKEKNVVLAISKLVRTQLSKNKQYITFMTREKDKTLQLQERTLYANTKGGDLFVSIHANASPRRSAKGVSTYFLNNADDQESLRVAMRENGELDPSNLRVPSGSDDYYLEIMKASMIKNFHTTQSTDLARAVQKKMMQYLSPKYSEVVNLGVRSARFYVLTGAKMPSILVETSFISNPTEEKRLTSPDYQEKLSQAIVEGIEAYVASEQSGHQ